MKKKIHNIESLEKEILRLRLKQKDTEHQLDKQWGKMKQNFGSLIWNSFRRRKDEEEEEKDKRPGFFESFLNNEKVDETLHNISDKISGKLSDVVNSLFEKFLKK